MMTTEHMRLKATSHLIEIATAVLTLFVTIALSVSNAQADSTIFSDNFTETTLNPAWQVLPGQGSYSVGGGQLRYYDDGPVASTTGWYDPALTLALPFTGTHWKVTTEATYNLYSLDRFGNSAGAQGPVVLVKFNPAITTSGYGGPNYAGSDYAIVERNIDAYYDSNSLSASYGGVTDGNLLNPADSAIKNNVADGTYWYEITRDGGTLTIQYSYDGVNYATAFSTTLSDPSSSYNELLLGGITYSSNGSYTNYSYVTITSPVPEPGTFAAFSVGLIGLGLATRLRCKTRPAAQ